MAKAFEQGITARYIPPAISCLQGPFVKLNDLMHLIETCTLPDSFAPGMEMGDLHATFVVAI